MSSMANRPDPMKAGRNSHRTKAKPKAKTRQINFLLTEEMFKRLKTAAVEHDTTVTALILESVEANPRI